MDELTQLHEKIGACKKCPLHLTCTQRVPGEGTLAASMVLLGEGPGAAEDEQGKPFVGRSGKFLRDQMRRNGLTTDHIYISNTVRCRPPNNRDPSPEEAEACWSWTSETLKLVRPRIIVTLGKPALITLARKLGFSRAVGQLSITKLTGKPIFVEDRNFYCFPMLHPAYALRRGEARAQFKADMKYLQMAVPGWLERPT